MLSTPLIIFYVLKLASTRNLKPEQDKYWSRSFAQSCKGVAVIKPLTQVGNFTNYGLKFTDFTEHTVLKLTLDSNKSYYDFNNIKTSLSKFNLTFSLNVGNDTEAWKNQKKYRYVFKIGSDTCGNEVDHDVETQDYGITIVPTLSVFSNGSIVLMNFVSVTSKVELNTSKLYEHIYRKSSEANVESDIKSKDESKESNNESNETNRRLKESNHKSINSNHESIESNRLLKESSHKSKESKAVNHESKESDRMTKESNTDLKESHESNNEAAVESNFKPNDDINKYSTKVGDELSKEKESHDSKETNYKSKESDPESNNELKMSNHKSKKSCEFKVKPNNETNIKTKVDLNKNNSIRAGDELSEQKENHESNRRLEQSKHKSMDSNHESKNTKVSNHELKESKESNIDSKGFHGSNNETVVGSNLKPNDDFNKYNCTKGGFELSREKESHDSNETNHESKESDYKSKVTNHKSKKSKVKPNNKINVGSIVDLNKNNSIRAGDESSEEKENNEPNESIRRSKESNHKSIDSNHESKGSSHGSKRSKRLSKESSHKSKEPNRKLKNSKESNHKLKESDRGSKESNIDSKESHKSNNETAVESNLKSNDDFNKYNSTKIGDELSKEKEGHDSKETNHKSKESDPESNHKSKESRESKVKPNNETNVKSNVDLNKNNYIRAGNEFSEEKENHESKESNRKTNETNSASKDSNGEPKESQEPRDELNNNITSEPEVKINVDLYNSTEAGDELSETKEDHASMESGPESKEPNSRTKESQEPNDGLNNKTNVEPKVRLNVDLYNSTRAADELSEEKQDHELKESNSELKETNQTLIESIKEFKESNRASKESNNEPKDSNNETKKSNSKSQKKTGSSRKSLGEKMCKMDSFHDNDFNKSHCVEAVVEIQSIEIPDADLI